MDLISRAEAVKAITRSNLLTAGAMLDCKRKIEGLPAAQPEIEERREESAQNVPKEDLISRKAAIDYCYQLINVEYQQGSDGMNYGQERINQTETILHHLELMPSAESDFITCADCRYADGQIADGRYWCKYHEDYMRYCSDAERREQ